MIDIETTLLASPWWSAGVWIALYISDYYLTIWGARLYAEGAKDHVVFEASYELTPTFQKDVNLLRAFSLRFLGYVVLSVAIVVGLWHVAHRWPDWREMFLFPYGGLVFRQLAILVRHGRNIALFRRLEEHRGIVGRVRYSQWLTLEMSWVEMFFTALLLLATAAVAAKVTLYGGAFGLFVTGLQHRKMSRRRLQEATNTREPQPEVGRVSSEARATSDGSST